MLLKKYKSLKTNCRKSFLLCSLVKFNFDMFRCGVPGDILQVHSLSLFLQYYVKYYCDFFRRCQKMFLTLSMVLRFTFCSAVPGADILHKMLLLLFGLPGDIFSRCPPYSPKFKYALFISSCSSPM